MNDRKISTGSSQRKAAQANGLQLAHLWQCP